MNETERILAVNKQAAFHIFADLCESKRTLFKFLKIKTIFIKSGIIIQ
jgi:hypothetical protein